MQTICAVNGIDPRLGLLWSWHVDWIVVWESAAVGLAGWAAWLALPRAPTLDWERLFKSALSVGIWAELEGEATATPGHAAVGGECGLEERWRAKVAEAVPYHPAGRRWRAKLSAPEAYEIEVPALSGERALVGALAGIEGMAERWDRLFGSRAQEVDLAVMEALGDPRELGTAYDPVRLLGPEAGWEGVAVWSDAVRSGLHRRLRHVVLIELGLSAVQSLAPLVPEVRHHTAASPGDAPPGGWLSLCSEPSDRLVVVVHGSLLREWLRLLSGEPALVDRVVLMVSPEGVAANNPEERAELKALLESEGLLPELQRRTPLAVVDHIDPSCPLETGMEPMVIDESDPDRLGVRWVDLGPLPVERLPPKPLGRALMLAMAFLLDG
jgi:hypothetical protein